MANVQVWDIDRVGASGVLADLGLELTDQHIESVAKHLAIHRCDAARWGAEKAHANIAQALTNQLLESGGLHDDHWYDGVRQAEAWVSVMSGDEILDLKPRVERSKGAILRSWIRQAKRAPGAS